MRAYPARRVLRRVEAVALLVFLATAADVTFDGLAARAVDPWVAEWVNGALSAEERATFEDVVSAPGHDVVIYAVVLLGAALCLALGRWFNAALLLGGGTVSLLLVQALKLVWERPRPFGVEGSGAFPSGHVGSAVIAWGLAFALVLDAMRNRKPGAQPALPEPPGLARSLLLLWAGIGVVVALGRVLGGVHWPTDVVGGFAFGTAAVCEVLAQHDRVADSVEPDRRREPPPPKPGP